MHKLNWAFVLGTGALLLASLWVSSCGNGSSLTALVPGISASPDTPGSPSISFVVPAPSSVLAGVVQKQGSDLLLERSGSDYLTDFAQRATIENTSARFAPAWTGGPAAFSTVAYAIYRFKLQDYPGQQTLQLSWGEAPQAYAQLWIGFSRWDRDRWDWYAGPSSSVLDLGAEDYQPFTKPATGDMLVAVVMTGTDPALLDKLQVGGITRGDWWMFGHDSRHTRRSLAQGYATPNLRWRYRTGAAVVSSPAFGADGAIYFGSDDGFIYALNPDCTVRWAYDTGSPVRSSPAVALDGAVYVGCDDSMLYAIGPDGALLWTFATHGAIYSSPALGSEGEVIFGCDDGFVYAVKPDGTLYWLYNTGIALRSSPVISADDTVYIGGDSHSIYSLSHCAGVVRSYSLGSDVRSSPAIGPDGTLYVGTKGGYLCAVTPDCNASKWRCFIGGEIGVSSPALAADGMIYIGAEDGCVYAVDSDPAIADPASRLKWCYATGGAVSSSPAVDRDGVVYIASQDGYVYALNPTQNPSGSLKWRYQTGMPVASSPALSENGEIIVGCDDGFLYALGASIICKPFGLASNNPATVMVGEDTAFDASRSYDPDTGSITKYEWDWTADGSYDLDTGTIPYTIHAYSTPGEKTCHIRVTDDEGATGVGSVITTVQLADVTGLSATDGTAVDRITLSWNSVLGAGGYELEYRPADPPDSPWQPLVTIVGGGTTSFEHTTAYPQGKEIQAGTLYTYHARAVYANCTSVNWSSADTGITWTGVCSGYVRTDQGLGLYGVALNFTGGLAGVTTDTNGHWSRDGIPVGTYMATPSLGDYIFTPASREFDLSGTDISLEDFTWTPPDHTAVGYVLNNAGTGFPGVLMSFSGGLAAVITDTNGMWTRPNIPDGSYTVTPSNNGYIFFPTSRDFIIDAGNASVDAFHGLPTPNLDPDTLYAIPLWTNAAVGEAVQILVASGQPAHALQYMSSVGFTIETAGTYVAQSFNIGVPGGGRDDTDGYWALLGPPPPEDGYYLDTGDGYIPGAGALIGGGKRRYNFAVIPFDDFAAPEAIGSFTVLFNFELSFSAAGTYHLGFQFNDGLSDQTYYYDADTTRFYWTKLNGSNTITVH